MKGWVCELLLVLQKLLITCLIWDKEFPLFEETLKSWESWMGSKAGEAEVSLKPN